MVRPHNDPRLTAARVGQVEHWIDGHYREYRAVVRHHEHETRPYQWRDPARARDWARLPPDLIELMKAEEVDALPAPQDSSRPPVRGPGRRLDAVPGGTARPGLS